MKTDAERKLDLIKRYLEYAENVVFAPYKDSERMKDYYTGANIVIQGLKDFFKED